MAIRFRGRPTSLVEELERAGYRISQVLSDAGDPRKSLQILLENGAVVNWDRDSRSIWAEGPAPLIVRLERALSSLSRGRGRARRSTIFQWFFAVICLLAGFIYLQHRLQGPPGEAGPGAAMATTSG